jgi:hypothetical protein
MDEGSGGGGGIKAAVTAVSVARSLITNKGAYTLHWMRTHIMHNLHDVSLSHKMEATQ